MEESFNKTVRETAKYWWIPVLVGIVMIGFSIWIVLTPLTSYLSLSILFSIILAVSGLAEVAFAINNRQLINEWGWLLVGGLIDLALGMYLLMNPAVTMTVLPLLVGVVLLIRGAFAIGSSLRLRSAGIPNWGWAFALGLALVVFAILMISNPTFGMFNIVIWTGMAFLSAGIVRISSGLRLRQIKERLDHK
ncbi:HdeD family acid-resistance protein [Spirosoma sp.]|uniref:HdeD family acid-resistance protein n=1 Tax=Spirosoma sp. TaxID=1899569 RepID=UPI003B3B9ACF